MLLYWVSEKQDQAKPQSSRWQEIIKIRAENNEIETKRIIHGIKELVLWKNKQRQTSPYSTQSKEGERRPRCIKLDMRKYKLQQVPVKSRAPLRNIFKTYIPKMLKLINSHIHNTHAHCIQHKKISVLNFKNVTTKMSTELYSLSNSTKPLKKCWYQCFFKK